MVRLYKEQFGRGPTKAIATSFRSAGVKLAGTVSGPAYGCSGPGGERSTKTAEPLLGNEWHGRARGGPPEAVRR